MLSATSIYAAARKRRDELMKIYPLCLERLKKAPEGKVHIVKSGKRVQYYLRTESNDKSGKYISKQETTKIRSYVQKSYDTKLLKLLKKELKSLNRLLSGVEGIDMEIKRLYSDNPKGVKQYLQPIDCTDEDYINWWKNIPYDGNPIQIQDTEFKTDNGEIVRSKSELNIANRLAKANIPYKYECPLKLKSGHTVYPDFTILDVKKRRIIYWEHRGIMDDKEYVKSSVKKVMDYSRNGIVGDNLIITEESLMNPLGTDVIDGIIEKLLQE